MTSFDRIKPVAQRLEERATAAPSDREHGRRAALFTAGRPGTTAWARLPSVPALPAAIHTHCERCEHDSVLTIAAAVRNTVPLALIMPWRAHPIFARCAACHRRAWLRVSLSGD